MEGQLKIASKYPKSATRHRYVLPVSNAQKETNVSSKKDKTDAEKKTGIHLTVTQ